LRGGASQFDHVGHFQSFNTGGIEHFGLVFEVNVLDFGNQGFDLVDTLVQQIQGTEHTAVSLHGHTNLVAHILGLSARCAGFQTVDTVQRVLDGGLVDFLVRVCFLGVRIHNVVARSATEHDQIQQGVRTQTVGTVHRRSGTFTDGVQTVDDLVLARWRLGHNLTVVVRGDTAHLVVDGWNHRDWVFDRVHVTELDRDFANRGQTFLDDVSTQVIQFQNHVAAIATTATFLDFLVHGAGHEVTWGQVFQGGSVTLHEALAVFIQQDTAFTAHAFGNQHASTGNASGVELPEFHV